MIIDKVRIKVTFSARRRVYWFTNSGVSLVNLKLTPNTESKERPNKGDHSLMVGGRFNKQENLPMRLLLGNRKDDRFLYPPTRILRDYTKA